MAPGLFPLSGCGWLAGEIVAHPRDARDLSVRSIGVSLHGVSFNGVSFNGVSFNGVPFNGVSFNGVSLMECPSWSVPDGAYLVENSGYHGLQPKMTIFFLFTAK